MRRKLPALLMTALLLIPIRGALGQEYHAQAAVNWMEEFTRALAALSIVNDPAQTADPSRPGEYLMEYEFGTVLARSVPPSLAEDILEIDVRTSQVTDCRGVRVGMTLDEALGSTQIPSSVESQLVVLNTQESGMGWSWAYVGEQGLYGLEWITYDMTDAAAVREYTLTYVVGEDGVIHAIRMKAADSTQAQAEAGVRTAQEIAGRQLGEALAIPNGEILFSEEDLQILGHPALGTPVYELVSWLGEPVEVQTLPAGGGRILLYEGAVVQLGLEEQTGEEIVWGLSVSGQDIAGPRGLTVGMSVQEATSLFRCDEELYASGGTLYMEGEARGEPPSGEMTALQNGEATLRYACMTASGRIAQLDVGLQVNQVAYWHLFYEGKEAEDGN